MVKAAIGPSYKPSSPRFDRALQRGMRLYPPGKLVLYGLTLYVLVASLATLWMAIDFRIAGNTILTGGLQEDPLYELGTSLGFWGILYFGLNFILATRWRWVETSFAGMDKVYQAHHLAGRLALTLLALHGVILLLHAIPDLNLLSTYLIPGVDWGYTTGVIGLLLLVLLVTFTIWVKLPYQTWLRSHKWMGVPYILGGLHAILLQGDWYMIAITALGSYAWLYKLGLYPKHGQRALGQVEKVNAKASVTELHIKLARPFSSKAGQFVFLSIQGAQDRVPAEVHPFSISGRPDAQTIRISAKALGDYTRALPSVHAGDNAVIWGPYGGFGNAYLTPDADLVWIAGGIGIKPFLDMLAHEQRTPSLHNRRIDFVWSVARADDAIYLDDIAQACSQLAHVHFHLHVTARQGMVTGDTILESLGAHSAISPLYFLCGPKSMMHALRHQLQARGAHPADIISEEFGMR